MTRARAAARGLIGFLVLAAFNWLGGRAHATWGIPLPGSVIGLALVAGVVAAAGRSPRLAKLVEPVVPVGRYLVSHLGLLFVPAGVGIVTEAAVLRREGWAILGALVLSTLLGMAVTGWLMQRWARAAEDASP
jgi:putative effector of murein hydrolase LrgA (UPF0299 family)